MNHQTILVTGGTGYIGSWVVKLLLERGYTVRVTVRNKFREAGYAHLVNLAKGLPGKLEIHEADLLKPGSYDAPARGADAVFHMASPFTLRFRNPEKDLIEPAVQGTLNVLTAASQSGSVKKIIQTSSVVAIYGDAADMQDLGLDAFTEEQFNTTSSARHQPYPYSKLLAEKAAWELAATQQQWQLVVVNPAFVMGPSISPASDSESIAFMKNMLTGKFFTGVPKLDFGIVDVRDVALAHILALETEKAGGRNILCAGSLSMMEMALIIKKSFPGKFRLPLMISPKFMVFLIGWAFGLSSRYVARNVGYPLVFDNTKSRRQLGLQFRPMADTLTDMVRQMANLP